MPIAQSFLASTTERRIMKKFNLKKIEKLIKQLLIELNDNPDREGLIETPKRVAKMYQEIFEGQLYTNQEIAEMFDKCFDIQTVNTSGLVVEKNISAFSTCEHHLATMYDMKISIGYIPKNKVIGLSKLNRICRMCAKRLQLQEKLGEDIVDVLQRILKTDDIAVFIEAKHMCVAMRGIKDIQSSTSSFTSRGRFISNTSLRSEFLATIK